MQFATAIQMPVLIKRDKLALIEWCNLVWTGMQGVQIHESGGLSGGADPRRDGTAIGY